jgi:hypothetical protein
LFDESFTKLSTLSNVICPETLYDGNRLRKEVAIETPPEVSEDGKSERPTPD